MPNFFYKGRNQGGALVSGNLWAASADAAASELSGNQIIPIDIRETKADKESARKEKNGGNALTGIKEFFSGTRIELTELIIFSRQMYSMAKAGIPLDKALKGIERSLDNYALKKVLQDLQNELEKGMALTCRSLDLI